MTTPEVEGRCVLVDLSAEESARLADLAPGHHISSAQLAAELREHGSSVDLVVIGALAPDPVPAVQRAHQLAPHAAVAVLAAAADADALRRRFAYTPGVPLGLLVTGADDGELPPRLQQLRSSAVGRRRHAAILAAVARSTGGTDSTSVTGPTAVGALLEHAPLAVVVTDATGALLAGNRRAEQLFGLLPEMTGRPVDDVLPGAHPLITAAAMAPGDATPTIGSPVQLRIANRVDVELSAVRSQTDNGKPAILLLAVDVTAQRHAERDRDRLATQVDLLGRVSESLMQSLDPAESQSRLARVLVPAIADWVSIQLWNDRDRPAGVLVRHRDPALAGVAGEMERLKSRTGVLTEPSRRAAAGQPVLLPQLDEQQLAEQVPDPELRALVQSMGAGSMVAVPVPGRTAVHGSLLLAHSSHDSRYGAADLAVAVEIGRRAGIALDNAQLYANQRSLATELQQSLLTAPPTVGFAEIAVRYLAAARQAQVGGDWYDAFRQHSGDLVLAIGDVVGHDTRAAAAMGQLRGLFRGICFNATDTPARLLTSVDEAMAGLELHTMATAILAQLTPPHRHHTGGVRMRWSNAGHPPPVLLNPSGRAHLLTQPSDRSDLLLGVNAATNRITAETPVPAGATLLFYTDGLIERRGHDLDEGLRKLVAVVEQHAAVQLDALCDEILTLMVPQAGEDDVAMIAVRLQ